MRFFKNDYLMNKFDALKNGVVLVQAMMGAA